jgi:TRAP transporter 4TM/12TM fusion protein
VALDEGRLLSSSVNRNMTSAVSSANADLQAGALPLTKPAYAVAVIFAAFQVFTAAYGPLSSTVVRALHVGFLLLLTFALLPPTGRRWVGWTIGAVGFAIGLYQWLLEGALIQRAGGLAGLDLAIGIVSIALVFEATRRTMGFALPLVCALFIAYALLGNHLPGPLWHPGYDLEQIVAELAFGTDGIYSTPIYVSATYIFLFILFGSFLEHAGALKLFGDVALGLFGRAPGGPAKACVASSALMGTISGSGVANVVASAPVVIPLMKRSGYRADFAGGVEAGSSIGGQLMPPVMGAVAFIMAEMLDVPYVEICKAAALPATLYFVACFWMVHLEANRWALRGLSPDETPSAWGALAQSWYLLLPLALLVLLLASGYTTAESGLAALALSAILVLGVAASLAMRGRPLRVLFWIVLGVACAAAMEHGVSAFLAIVAALVVVTAFVRGGRQTLRLLLDALADGARTALPVGTACAQVGVIVGVLALTGAASHFVDPVVAIGRNSLFAALLVTMVTCLVLGMGISTIPNYIIASAIAAPALLQLGVPLVVSHLFIFYFGIMADLTPPVALAAFAAAPYAGVSGMKIGAQAVRIALAGFVIPFMAVYSPALLLQAGGWLDVVYITLKTLIAIGLWGIAAVGYWRAPVNWFERVFAFVAAAFLVSAVPLTDEIGLLLCVLFVVWHLSRVRAARKRGAIAPSP